MKLKNIFKKSPSKYQLLKDEIKILEERIFNKKKESPFMSSYILSWGLGDRYEAITLEEEISILQDKLDVIAKHLGVSFVETQEKEKEWTVKKVKKSK